MFSYYSKKLFKTGSHKIENEEATILYLTVIFLTLNTHPTKISYLRFFNFCLDCLYNISAELKREEFTSKL